VRGLLAAAELVVADDVELMVGELTANAVRHSDSGRMPHGVVRVRVYEGAGVLRVEVADAGSVAPIPEVPVEVPLFSESGRGLWLVQRLSSAWGWYDTSPGRVVWFELVR
jgi:anti-sigma regulatory factor (Ser/Thr protein kinase)